jgi:hypothetical protein
MIQKISIKYYPKKKYINKEIKILKINKLLKLAILIHKQSKGNYKTQEILVQPKINLIKKLPN